MLEQLIAYVAVDKDEQKAKEKMLELSDNFDNLFTRKNEEYHYTSSGLILNPSLDKVLAIHHNIYNEWGWTGGHMDGDTDFRYVALKEAKEETGIENVNFFDGEIATLDILPVQEHMKNGKLIKEHKHLSIAYILIAEENQQLFVKRDENTGVKWFGISDFLSEISNPIMLNVYQKILKRVE